MGLFTLYCFCWFLFLSFSFLCLNVFDCLLAIPVNRLSDLPQTGSAVVPFTPGQCRLDPSSHILFFRVHSAQVLWHWYVEPHSSCSVAVMSQGFCSRSFFLPSLLLSTRAFTQSFSLMRVEVSLTFPLEQSPLKSRLHSGWVSSGFPALLRLSPDFCSLSMPVVLEPSPLIRGVKCCPLPGTGEGVVVCVSSPRTYMIWGAPVFWLILWFLGVPSCSSGSLVLLTWCLSFYFKSWNLTFLFVFSFQWEKCLIQIA